MKWPIVYFCTKVQIKYRSRFGRASMCSSMSPQGTEDDEIFRPFFHGKPLRGLLPIAVLGLIKDKPAHGGDIYQRLREKFDIETPRPVVYLLLRKFEKGGFIVSTWDIQESGPAKRRY